MKANTDNLNILECTIRDGNYAVDFKFTEADTALVSSQLERLGFKWIEVGHGLGLGGMEAGKGKMPARDVELIRAAKRACKSAFIGAFFIPGIGRMEDLQTARDAGLDFVRIGQNAPDSESTYDYITHARKIGLVPCLNMMKSYGVTPEEFAQKAKGAVEAGAEIVYCVDSAGSMFPRDVANYFDATKAVVDCKMGFHGHNNLMMVIANCLTAYEHGVRFLDTTLTGIGRSAGNAPTEIFVAVFERHGIKTGIDLFDLMDTIETYMWPLVSQVRPHDMTGIVAGYSQFHSSFLPEVAKTARRCNVELRRLIAKVAFHDPVNLDSKYLQVAAKELSGYQAAPQSKALLDFHAPGLPPEKVSHSLKSADLMIEGLVTASAKRTGTKTVLHIVPSEEASESLLLSEFVMADSQVVMGRVIVGSEKLLDEVLELAKPYIFMFLVNEAEGWAQHLAKSVGDEVGVDRTVVVRDKQLQQVYLLEALDEAAKRFGNKNLLVYGPTPIMIEILKTYSGHEKVIIYNRPALVEEWHKRVIVLDQLSDWRNLGIEFDLILCGAHPNESDALVLSRLLKTDGRLISVLKNPGTVLKKITGSRLLNLDLNQAFSGWLGRHLALTKSLSD